MARILVAEGDPLVASFLEKGLRSHGLTPFVVDHGEHAQELGLSGAFDLLLLEIGLPGRDGFHVRCEWTCSRGARPSMAALSC